MPTPTTLFRRIRRPGRWTTAASAALVGAATLAGASGTVDAETRNPCSDLLNQARVSLQMATWYGASGSMLLDMGAIDAANDHFYISQYFSAASGVYLSDYENLGC